MKINNAKYFIIAAWILLHFLIGCKKETVKVVPDKINDYLPLTVGAKYKYQYETTYSYVIESSITKGECTWNFISMSADTTVVYHVEQSFTGYYVHILDHGPAYPIQKDTTQFVNQISTLSFEVQKDGKVAFTNWGGGKVIFERFIQSDRIDTCFTLNTMINRGCLRKNVGITNLFYFSGGNHSWSTSYSLIEGPTY